jgi:hypothetical protein
MNIRSKIVRYKMAKRKRKRIVMPLPIFYSILPKESITRGNPSMRALSNSQYNVNVL